MSHPAPTTNRTAAVGANLLAALTTAGLSITAAADIVDREQADLEEAIAGVAPLHISELVALAANLGVAATSLLGA